MDVPPETIESERKRAIMDEYHALCQGYVPYLYMMINSRMPGNMVSIFEQFKLHFVALFLLTSDKKGLNKDVKASVKKWLDTKHKTPYESDMTGGLNFFEQYKAELFRMEVL